MPDSKPLRRGDFVRYNTRTWEIVEFINDEVVALRLVVPGKEFALVCDLEPITPTGGWEHYVDEG